MTDACLDQVPTQSEEKMVSSRDGKISKVEVLDRLSNLSDDLIHKILSFISLKQAVETSVLSSRWRFIWKSMSYLNFSTDDFSTIPNFSNFVEAFFSYRIKDIEVSFVKLSFSTYFTQWFVKSIFKYVFTHNIPQVTIICSIDYDNIVMPLNFSGSQSLKHLSLIKDTGTTQSRCFIRSLSGCELPELTTLYLSSLTCFISDNRDIGFFKCLSSTCPKLMNLTLKGLKTFESNSVSICHPLLSNFTLEDGDCSVEVVHLVAPRLKNLNIINMPKDFQLEVSAPELASFVCKGYYPVELNTDGFHCLEKADLCVYNTHNAGAHQMVCLLQHLYCVKSLTLNLEIVELLSLSDEPILHEPFPFTNLKNLTIYPEKVFEWEFSKEKVSISTIVKNYLQNSSPRASFTMGLREEIMVVENVTSAQKLLTELRDLLDQVKDDLEKEKATTESRMEIDQKKARARLIIAKLQNLEGLLTKLPQLNRAMIQPCYSNLCAEADIIISKITC